MTKTAVIGSRLRLQCRAVAAFSECRYRKLLINQRGSGMSGSSGILLYPHVRTRTHHVKNACHALHAATALFLKGFLVAASKICRYCRYQLLQGAVVGGLLCGVAK